MSKKSKLRLLLYIIVFVEIVVIIMLLIKLFSSTGEQTRINNIDAAAHFTKEILSEVELVKSEEMNSEEKQEVRVGEKEVVDNSWKESDLSRFYGYDFPLAFSLNYNENDDGKFEYEIKDTGECYLLRGCLVCPEVIGTYCWGEVGDHFETISGRGYTVVNEESYNSDQRQRVTFLGEDGKTYVISNLPAFSMDAYTGALYNWLSCEDEGSYQTNYLDVVLRIDYDTVFSSSGITFDSCYKSGSFDNLEENIGYDIHFTKEGKLDVLTGGNANGLWNCSIWEDRLE